MNPKKKPSLHDQVYADLLRDYEKMLMGNLGSQPIWTPPAEPEKPKEVAPAPEKVVHGSVIGYRAWRIQDWQLYGTGVNRAWVPGTNEATCDTGSGAGLYFSFDPPSKQHAAPHIGCHCGITCLARFVPKDSHWQSADVFGAIEAWSDETVQVAEPGDVAHATGVHEHDRGGGFILHGNGFRARYGKVVLLAVDDDWPSPKKAAVRALAREYEADVCKHAHLEDAAKEHGQLVPDELLEWAKEGDSSAALTPAQGLIGSGLGSGYFTAPVWTSGYLNRLTTPSFSFSISPGRVPSKPKRGASGMCKTIGYPGPPNFGKFREGNRVQDSKKAIWRCVKGGKPGQWEAEG